MVKNNNNTYYNSTTTNNNNNNKIHFSFLKEGPHAWVSLSQINVRVSCFVVSNKSFKEPMKMI